MVSDVQLTLFIHNFFLLLNLFTSQFLAPVFLLHEPDYEQTTSHSISTREARKRTRSSDFVAYQNRQIPTTQRPTTTTLSSENNGGCMVDGTYYEEGEQLPTNKTNGRCETCYCRENVRTFFFELLLFTFNGL